MITRTLCKGKAFERLRDPALHASDSRARLHATFQKAFLYIRYVDRREGCHCNRRKLWFLVRLFRPPTPPTLMAISKSSSWTSEMYILDPDCFAPPLLDEEHFKTVLLIAASNSSFTSLLWGWAASLKSEWVNWYSHYCSKITKINPFHSFCHSFCSHFQFVVPEKLPKNGQGMGIPIQAGIGSPLHSSLLVKNVISSVQ